MLVLGAVGSAALAFIFYVCAFGGSSTGFVGQLRDSLLHCTPCVRLLGCCFGKRCASIGRVCKQWCARTEEVCCWRPNPLLQLIYLSLMGGGFALFLAGSYPLIPNPNLTEYHKPTSFIVMCGGIWIFILASFGDPGTITAANLHRYSRLPYDQVPTHIQALPPQRHS